MHTDPTRFMRRYHTGMTAGGTQSHSWSHYVHRSTPGATMYTYPLPRWCIARESPAVPQHHASREDNVRVSDSCVYTCPTSTRDICAHGLYPRVESLTSPSEISWSTSEVARNDPSSTEAFTSLCNSATSHHSTQKNPHCGNFARALAQQQL